jgi:hypothetical protein
MAEPQQIIATLNAIGVGDMDVIRDRLEQARSACRELDQAELVGKLDEAIEALARADMRTYRKRVETVVARLGHLK